MTTEGLFVSTDGSGNISNIKQHTDWDRGWDLIVPGNFGGDGHTDLLFYKRLLGSGLFVTTDGSGNILRLRQYTDWDRGWDLIVPGNFGGDGHTDLLFYKRAAGTALFVSTDGSGNIGTIKQHTDWDKDWDLIVPGDFGGDGHTDLLFYKRSIGMALFVSTDGSGNVIDIKQHTDWDRGWDLIVPGNFGGNGHTDLLFYKRAVGTGLFVSTDGNGNIIDIKQSNDWDRDWTLIIPGNFGGDRFTDLLFYKRPIGEGLFVSTDGGGNIRNIKRYIDWDRDWRQIVPGDFGGNNFTDLLFYTARPPKGPTRLHVTRVTEGGIDVAWADNSNDEDGFRVRFRGKKEGMSDHTGTVPRPRNSVTASLINLQNNTDYAITVAAFNADGESPRSNTVRAKTLNELQIKTVALQRQPVAGGFPAYAGKYPDFGFVPPGRLLRIRVPQSGLVDFALAFVKAGHSTQECGNSNAVVEVAEGATTTPAQMTAIYGVPEPKYPVAFVACFVTPSGSFPDFVNIEITIMED